jgi:hypothetical protein
MKLPAVPLKAGWCFKAEFTEATRLRSKELQRVHLAIHPSSPAESGTGYDGEGE